MCIITAGVKGMIGRSCLAQVEGGQMDESVSSGSRPEVDPNSEQPAGIPPIQYLRTGGTTA